VGIATKQRNNCSALELGICLFSWSHPGITRRTEGPIFVRRSQIITLKQSGCGLELVFVAEAFPFKCIRDSSSLIVEALDMTWVLFRWLLGGSFGIHG
jgi:hypothetical protein